MDSLQHVNLGKSVYATLRDALAAGRFQPNDRLRIRELALQLGTSVTPVRDAMLQLVQEEALVLRSPRDFRVPVLSVARYLEIRALRLELEGLGAFEAAQRIDAATLADLERLLQANEEAIARHDLPAALQCNQAFHLGLAQAAGMPTLKRFVEHLWMQTAPLIAAGYASFSPDMRVGTCCISRTTATAAIRAAPPRPGPCHDPSGSHMPGTMEQNWASGGALPQWHRRLSAQSGH